MRLCLSPNGVGAPSLLRSAAVGTSTLRRHRPAVMLDLPPALEVDGLVALTLPVLLVPTLIFVVATIGPLLQPRQRGDARLFETRARQAVSTLLRIGIPSLLAAVAGFFYFDNLSLYISSTLDVRTLSVLARDNDSGQFIQNFTTVAGTLFAILAGNAYADLYAQQEEIYFAVYREVTTAKLLLEQLTLVGQARPWYPAALRCMREYLNDDLRRTDVVPSERLSAQRASTVAKCRLGGARHSWPPEAHETASEGTRRLLHARGRSVAAPHRNSYDRWKRWPLSRRPPFSLAFDHAGPPTTPSRRSCA